ncbi:hypothetical protein KIL84_017378, partial [Mauremys mutica]
DTRKHGSGRSAAPGRGSRGGRSQVRRGQRDGGISLPRPPPSGPVRPALGPLRRPGAGPSPPSSSQPLRRGDRAAGGGRGPRRRSPLVRSRALAGAGEGRGLVWGRGEGNPPAGRRARGRGVTPFPPSVPGLSEAGPPRPIMWKLNKSSKVLLDDSPDEEETRLRDPPPQPAAAAASAAQNKDQFLHDEVTSSVSQLATKVQSASFRGWKEVTSMFNKDDEQQLLAGCKAPKSKGTNLKLKEDVKSEKKFGFWDSLAIKQNTQSRKPDQIEGWEPPQITAGDPISDAGNTLSDYPSWSGWEDETKGSTKYTNLASSGNSSRWSIKSAGKLVSIRRQSKGNLTDNWEELE